MTSEQRGTETVYLPTAALSCVLLGPGTSITARALATFARQGTTVVISGSGGVRTYAAALPDSLTTAWLERQTRAWADDDRRLAVATAMYEKQFGTGTVPPGTSTAQLRRLEGQRVKAHYRLLAQQYRIGPIPPRLRPRVLGHPGPGQPRPLLHQHLPLRNRPRCDPRPRLLTGSRIRSQRQATGPRLRHRRPVQSRPRDPPSLLAPQLHQPRRRSPALLSRRPAPVQTPPANRHRHPGTPRPRIQPGRPRSRGATCRLVGPGDRTRPRRGQPCNRYVTADAARRGRARRHGLHDHYLGHRSPGPPTRRPHPLAHRSNTRVVCGHRLSRSDVAGQEECSPRERR